jgi:AcrR family transcriptional regulator
VTKSSEPTRRYTLRQRAERQKDTRRRITEATIRLHEEVGPLQTTVAEVARRAGVERPTVYRHFPDEISLLRACQQDWLAATPPPDFAAWATIVDPGARLSAALAELYAFYRHGAAMMDNLLRDAAKSAAVREVLIPVHGALREATEILVAGFAAPASVRRMLRVAVAHAVAFGTWKSLTEAGARDDREAAGLMASFIMGVAEAQPAVDRHRA